MKHVSKVTTFHSDFLDNCLSPYSFPLPIKREIVPAQKQPSVHHRMIKELRAQREKEIQAEYLGTPCRLAATTFFNEILELDGEIVEQIITGQVTQALSPTFNSTAPSHLTYTELNRVHWNEPGLWRPVSHFQTIANDESGMEAKPPRTPQKISSRFRNGLTKGVQEITDIPSKLVRRRPQVRLEMIATRCRQNQTSPSTPAPQQQHPTHPSKHGARPSKKHTISQLPNPPLPTLSHTTHRGKAPKTYKSIPQWGADDTCSSLAPTMDTELHSKQHTQPHRPTEVFVEELM
jgi:hypothetical protein